MDLAAAAGDGVVMDFVCGDEIYGSSAQLRLALETGGPHGPRTRPGSNKVIVYRSADPDANEVHPTTASCSLSLHTRSAA